MEGGVTAVLSEGKTPSGEMTSPFSFKIYFIIPRSPKLLDGYLEEMLVRRKGVWRRLCDLEMSQFMQESLYLSSLSFLIVLGWF